MLDILTLGDETLREKSDRITEFGPEIAVLADAMIDSMREEQGIGLAGPQIGVTKRIFVTGLVDEEPIVFINPEIIETSQETVVFEEGCLSIPGVYADVRRPSMIKIQAQDVKGKPFTLEASGMLARVIQHENDHLQGVLFVDKLSELVRECVLSQYKKRQRRER